MPATIFLNSEDSTWTAAVDDDHVVLTGDAGTFVVNDERDDRFRVTGSSGTLVASAVQAGSVIWIAIDGHVLEMHAGTGAPPPRPATRDEDSLAPLMSATVVKIHVRPGDRVQEGDTLVTLEAMKMEMPIKAPRAATIAAVNCSEGALAPAGTPVVTLRD